MSDYAVRCYDCDVLYAPLSPDAAARIATEHTESYQHSSCHAVSLLDLMPLIGYFEPANINNE